MTKTKGPVLIIGGAGKTGRRGDALLRPRGIATRPVSRSTTPAFDGNRPKDWAAEALGRPARDFSEFVGEGAVAGTWSTSP